MPSQSGSGKRLWADEYIGCQGVLAVAISGDGTVAAAGGLYTDHADGDDQPEKYQGLLRAYDAATGDELLDYTGIVAAGPGSGRAQRVSCVALSDNGKVLAAVADRVYVFLREGSKFPDLPSEIITFDDAFNESSLPTAVAVHSSGDWLAACDKGGNVCLAEIVGGQVQQPIRWAAPQVPINRSDKNSPPGPIIFLSLAISKQGSSFVVGGNDYVFLFMLERMRQQPGPVTSYDTWDQTPPPLPANGVPAKTPPQNVRWVAISGNGSLITAVVNRYRGGQKNGTLLALHNSNGQLSLDWEQQLPRNPNSTSVDTAGRYVAACDGYPFGTPGAFYNFDSNGMLRWTRETENMNWPVVISGNGEAIAGGGDDGMLYSFNP